MMADREVNVTDDEIANWVNEIFPGVDDSVGDTRMEKTKMYSPSFVANNAQNTTARLSEEVAARTAITCGVSQKVKPTSSSGWTTTATIIGTSSSTPCFHATWPTGLANMSKEYLGQTSNMVFPQPHQEQYLHQSIQVPEPRPSQEFAYANARGTFHSAPMLQRIPHQNFQEVSQPIPLQQNMGAQPVPLRQNMGAQPEGALSREGARIHPQRAGYLSSTHCVVSDRSTHKEQPNKMILGSSSGSRSPIILKSSRDWQTQAYSELLYLRETHMGDLFKTYNRAKELSRKPFSAELIKKLEMNRASLQRIIIFLQMSPADFLKQPRELFDLELKKMKWYINKFKSTHHPVQHPQGVHQPSSQLTTLPGQYRGNENIQINQTRQDSTSRHGSEGHFLTKQGNLTGIHARDSSVNSLMRSKQQSPLGWPQQANSSFPSQVGSQNELQQRVSSSMSCLSIANSNLPSQVGSQNELQQRVSSSTSCLSIANMGQNSLNSPMQVNSSAMDMVNALESTMGSLPSNTTPSLPPYVKERERMKQPVQQASVYDYMQKLLAQKAAEINESKLRQVTSNQRMPQPNHLIGQLLEHPSPLSGLSSTSQQHLASPQVSEHPSQHVDVMNSSPLHRETRRPENSKQSHVEDQGFSRLNDKDLEYGMGSNTPEVNFKSCSEDASHERAKHDITMSMDPLPSPSDGSNGLPWLSGQTSDTGTSATFYTMPIDFEWNNLLLQEIKKINEKLIETVLEANLDKTDMRTRNGEGTIVKFFYRAISHNFPSLPFQVLVRADYPHSSPLILDSYLDSGEMKPVWDKAKSKFNCSLRKCSEPLSLKDMATCWDTSARQAFCEFAELVGGGCFSSNYGSWENYTVSS